MPQDNAYARLSGHILEAWRRTPLENGEWLTRLFSGSFAVAAIALLKLAGRAGRVLLMVSVLFVIIVEVIISALVLAQVAACVLPFFTSNTQGDTDSAITNSAASSRNDERNSAQRQKDKIQNHLQQLVMAAAAADAAVAAAKVTPSLHYHRDRVTVEYPERNGTILAVTTSSRSNSPAASAFTGEAGQASSNPGSTDLCTTGHHRHREGLGKNLQEDEKSVVIHFQLPVYVCNLTFWNDIQITVPSSSRSLSRSSTTAAGKNNRTTKDHVSASSTDGNRATGLVYQMEMRMWMETNRDLVADGTLNDRKPCKDCLMGSHTVGKRRFECTYLEGRLDGHLDVHKTTFHAGRKLTILGSNSGLNFKFETTLQQTLALPGSNAPSFQQRATFTLLSRTSRVNDKSSNQQQQSSKVDQGGSSKKRLGRIGPGLLATFRTNNATQTALPNGKSSNQQQLLSKVDQGGSSNKRLGGLAFGLLAIFRRNKATQLTLPDGKSSNKQQQSSKVDQGGSLNKRLAGIGSGLLAIFRGNKGTLPALHNGKSSNKQQHSSKVDQGGSSNKSLGGIGSGLLAIFKGDKATQSALTPILRCSADALYPLEHRHLSTKD